jgi:hypothetical protein
LFHEAANVVNDLGVQMKNVLRIVASLVVVVVVASGCSYSEDAEPGVWNFGSKTRTSTCMEDIGRGELDWDCLTNQEQELVATYLWSVNELILQDGDEKYLNPPTRHTHLLDLLIRYEALELLCYTEAFPAMYSGRHWPYDSDRLESVLPFRLHQVRRLIDEEFSQQSATERGEQPALKKIQYQHLCPEGLLH